MKKPMNILPLLILSILAASLVLLNGCGSAAKDEGCPAVNTLYTECSAWANSTDSIVGPQNDEITMSSPFVGGSVAYSPLSYTVTDNLGAPRNGVCVEFTTDGTFYSDRNYANIAPSLSTVGGDIILRTNDRGTMCVYWSTASLPLSSSGEQSGTSWINALSGAVSHDFTVDWTVSAS